MKVVIVSMSPGREFSLAPVLLKVYSQKFPELNRDVDITLKGYAGRVKNEQIFGNVFTSNAYNIAAITEEIIAEEPDLVAFSCYIWNINYVLKAGKIIKAKYPRVTIILGGPQVTPYSEEILKKHPYVDLIVRGEGEVTFSKLLKFFALGEGNLSETDGITYREGKAIKRNKDAALIENLDEIPSPYLTGAIDLQKIGNTIGCYETYRGCVMGCRFCNWGKSKRIRYYSLNRIKEEIKLIGASPVKRVWFADSIANLNKERFKEILHFIIDHNPNKVTFDFEMMAELLDEETIDLLGKANVGYIAFGLQTTCDQALAACGRHWNKEKFEKNIKLLAEKTNIDIYIDLIYGLPGDNWQTYRKSLEYCATLYPRRIQHHSLQILPGSEFFENPGKYGLQFSPKPPYWAKCSNTFSAQDMKEAKKWLAYLELYHFKPVNMVLRIISNKLKKNPIDVLEQYADLLRGKISLNKIISPVIRADTKVNHAIANALVQATEHIIEESKNDKLRKLKTYLSDLIRFECFRFAFSIIDERHKYCDPQKENITLLHKPKLINGAIVAAFSYDIVNQDEYKKVLGETDYQPPRQDCYFLFESTKISRINYYAYALLARCQGELSIGEIIADLSAQLEVSPGEIQVKVLKSFIDFSKRQSIGFLKPAPSALPTRVLEKAGKV